MIQLFPIVVEFMSVTSVIVSELCYKSQVELQNQVREEL